jgi:hypothetical protein
MSSAHALVYRPMCAKSQINEGDTRFENNKLIKMVVTGIKV